MDIDVIMFEQDQDGNPFVTNPSLQAIMNMLQQMKDRGFEQVVVCALPKRDPQAVARLKQVIGEQLGAGKATTVALAGVGPGDFEQYDPDWFGFILNGPCGQAPFDGVSESDFSQDQLRYGLYSLVHPDSSGHIGDLVSFPPTYLPLNNTAYFSRDFWRWAPGEEWPASFVLEGSSGLPETSTFGAWEAYEFGYFTGSTGGAVPEGTIYKITRLDAGPPKVVGFMGRFDNGGGTLHYWARSDELTPDYLIRFQGNSRLRFDLVDGSTVDVSTMIELITPHA